MGKERGEKRGGMSGENTTLCKLLLEETRSKGSGRS